MAQQLPYTRKQNTDQISEHRSHILVPLEITMGVHRGKSHSQYLPIMDDI